MPRGRQVRPHLGRQASPLPPHVHRLSAAYLRPRVDIGGKQPGAGVGIDPRLPGVGGVDPVGGDRGGPVGLLAAPPRPVSLLPPPACPPRSGPVIARRRRCRPGRRRPGGTGWSRRQRLPAYRSVLWPRRRVRGRLPPPRLVHHGEDPLFLRVGGVDPVGGHRGGRVGRVA